MSKDSSLYVRKAVIRAWREFAPLVALVPKTQIFPPQLPANPAWPFVRYGTPNTEPFLASGMDGSAVDILAQGYAETTLVGGETQSGEEAATAIGAQMVAALEAPLDLEPRGCPYPAIAYVTWERTQVIQDPTEADRFRALVAFSVNVVS